VGAGVGMVSFQLKAGIGTSSRVVTIDGVGYTLGALVLANTGTRELLTIQGLNVGRSLKVPMPSWLQEGSIIVVLATDAPLLPRQLKRLAKRAEMGLARTGAVATNGSGDFSLAFSTANRNRRGVPVHSYREIDNDVVSPLFQAAAEATEESVINALCAATDFTGRDGNRVWALPTDQLAELLRARPAAS
jgi:D-aminopeptidase